MFVLFHIASVFSLSNLVLSRWMFERAPTSICACCGDCSGPAFPTEINSIKHKHIRSLWHNLRAQSIKFGIGQVGVRTSTYEHVRAFVLATVTEVGITIILPPYKYKYGEGTLTPWHRIAFRTVACVYQAEKNDHSFQSHPDRVCPALKK